MSKNSKAVPLATKRRSGVAARLAPLALVLASAGWTQAPQAAATATDAEPTSHWTARRIDDVFRNESRCVAESAAVTIDDGRSPTKVFLRVDAGSLMIMTESNVDLDRPDVVIQVDEHKPIRPDRVFLDQNLLFETQAALLIAQFKAGLAAEARLRFWPTWPDKGLKTVRFSLIGFTRAFSRLPGC